jgi:hypothetical protein
VEYVFDFSSSSQGHTIQEIPIFQPTSFLVLRITFSCFSLQGERLSLLTTVIYNADVMLFMILGTGRMLV